MEYVKAYFKSLIILGTCLGFLYVVEHLLLGAQYNLIAAFPYIYLAVTSSVAGPIGVWIDK